MKKESVAGLKTLCQRTGCYSPCRGMYLELRNGPMSREHARPQPPAGSRRYGGGEEEPAPVPVGVTGHRTQRPRGQVGPPRPHPAQPSSSLDPGGERWPIFRPLAPLIAQLVPAPQFTRAIPLGWSLVFSTPSQLVAAAAVVAAPRWLQVVALFLNFLRPQPAPASTRCVH